MTATHDITAFQGVTLDERFEYEDERGDLVDVTGWSARMQVRAAPDAPLALLTLASAAAGADVIEVGGAATPARVRLRASAATMRGVPLGGYVYDVLLTSPAGDTLLLVQGRFLVRGTVTHVE